MLSVLVDNRALTDGNAYRGIGRYTRAMVSALGDAGVNVVGDAKAADVVFNPNLDPRRRYGPPWVQTVYDVTPLTWPDRAFRPYRRRWRRRARRIRKADAVIAVSQHTADEAVRHLRLDPSRVHVVHLAADERFVPAVRVEADEPFVLMVSEYGPHKGFAEAFAVIGALAEQGLPHRLRVAGRLAPWVRPAVEKLVAASPRADRVDLLGFVGDDELAGLYQQASAVLVPTRAEGFCLPLVEAMSCATPVVAFDIPVIREVGSTGAVLVDDGNVDAMAAATASVLTDGARWQGASSAALDRAGHFSWQGTARRHAEIFGTVAR